MSRLRSSEAITGIAAVGVIIAVSLAALLANAQSIDRIASDSAIAVHAETALGAAATLHNRTAQAQVLAAAAEVGAADVEEARSQLRQAETALTSFIARIDSLTPLLDGPAAGQINDEATQFHIAATAAINHLQDGDSAASSEVFDDALEPAYEPLAASLIAERSFRLDAISIAQAGAGRIVDSLRFLVAFFVPLGVVMIYVVISRRRHNRLELEQQLEKQLAVLRTKDEFIANLSHELRTPLTSIYGFSMAMLEVEHLDPVLEEMAGYVTRESAELNRMVDDLLAAGAWDNLAFHIEPVDPSAEVSNVTAPYEALGISITAQMEPALVDADRMRLGQVLRNLISNAEKHGGANVRVTGRSEGGGYVIRVTDDGPGVPAEYRDTLFERYIHQGSTPLQTGSVGLGLANAQMMTTKMGGSLTYLRDDGITIFEVRLAIAKPTSDEAAIQTDFEAAGPRDPWLSNREVEQRASQRQIDAGTQSTYPLRPIGVGTSGVE